MYTRGARVFQSTWAAPAPVDPFKEAYCHAGGESQAYDANPHAWAALPDDALRRFIEKIESGKHWRLFKDRVSVLPNQREVVEKMIDLVGGSGSLVVILNDALRRLDAAASVPTYG